jgi:hypothetical protein
MINKRCKVLFAFQIQRKAPKFLLISERGVEIPHDDPLIDIATLDRQDNLPPIG